MHKDTMNGVPSRPNHIPGSNSILSTSCSGYNHDNIIYQHEFHTNYYVIALKPHRAKITVYIT